MQLSKLTDLVTKLSSRIEVLEKDLQKTKQTYSTALTKLVLKVKKLEKLVKTSTSRKRVRLVLSEEEDVLDDSSKQGRNISDIDEDPDTVLVEDNGVEWVQEDAEVQYKASNETEPILQDDTPTEVIQDQGSAERGQPKVSTAGIPVSTAGVTASTTDEQTGTASINPTVSTAHINISTASTIRRDVRSTAGRVVYRRRSK
ncbi:hypothetical protein Tco_0034645 [Tanacetum coccineum]